MRGLALVALVGCVHPSVVTCEDGRTCPAGAVCDATHHLCVSPDALAVCANLGDGTACSFAGRDGVCDLGICVEVVCGDGVQLGLEQCDGADVPVSSCRDLFYYDEGVVTCTSGCMFDVSDCHRTCGDGVTDLEEQCDSPASVTIGDCKADYGYYEAGEVRCGPTCVPDLSQCKGFCGDGNVDAEESCEKGVSLPVESCVDLGFDAGRVECTSFCTPDTSGCKQIGWKRVLTPTQAYYNGIAMISASQYFLAADQGLVKVTNKVATALPPSLGLLDLWGTATDLWGVGEAGYVGHYNGVSMTQVLPPDSSNLYSVWGSSATNVWTVGDGRVLRNAGSGFSAVATDGTRTFADVSGTSNGSDVFVVGGQLAPVVAEIYHWSGTWPAQPDSPNLTGSFSPSLYGVHAFSASAAVAVGNFGAVTRWNGSTWIQEELDPNEAATLRDVWGRSPTDMYTVGDDGNSRGFVGYYDGSWWKLATGISLPLNAITGVGQEVYAVGVSGGVFRDSHAAWTTAIPYDGTGYLVGVWTTGPNEHYVITEDTLSKKSGATFKVLRTLAGGPDAISNVISSMWQQGSAIAFVFNQSVNGGYSNTLVQRFDGSWTTDSLGGPAMFAVAGTSATNLFVGGTGAVIKRFGGTGWTEEHAAVSGHAVYGMWAAGAVTIAVGDNGAGAAEILERSGTTWIAKAGLPAGSRTLRAIWGASATDVYTVGDAGTILHYNGTSWMKQTAPTTFDLLSISGSGPDDIWATGKNSAILHYDGTAWTEVRPPPSFDSEAINSVAVRPGLVLFSAPALSHVFGLVRTGAW